MKNLSLRARLALLVALSVALAAGPILYLTRTIFEETIVTLETENFALMLSSEEEYLNASFMDQLGDKVKAVRDRKVQLREAARRARDLLSQLDALKGTLSPDQAEQLSQATLGSPNRVDVQVGLAGSAAPLDRSLRVLALSPDSTDAKHRRLDAILTRLPPDGDFAVMNLPRRLLWPEQPEGMEQALLFFLPAHRTWTRNDRAAVESPCAIVAYSSLSELELQEEESIRLLLTLTQERYAHADLYVYDGGFIGLIDREGRILASGGDGSLPLDALEPALAEARRRGRAQRILPTDNGDLLCLVSYSRPFQWHLVVTSPLSEIRAPSDVLLYRLVVISLGIMLLTSFFALFSLVRSLQPLRLLTSRTAELAAVDFSAVDALDRIEPLMARGLPLGRNDEIGRLAQSFAHMGRALADNIRNLMEATAGRERMEGELAAAHDIQVGILPPPDSAPAFPHFSVAASLVPAREVGGDLYDFFPCEGGSYALVLGDVSGKGVPAALFMTMTVTLVRQTLGSGLDPAQAMTAVNAMLEEHNPGNMFVTLFLAIYNPANGELRYANGGHCLPWVVSSRPDAPPRLLAGLSGPLVGVLPDISYELFQDRLEEGESCLIYSDGVTEAMNENKKLFGEERLREFLAAHRPAAPGELLDELARDLCAYRGQEPQSDDITMLVFRRCSPAPDARDTGRPVQEEAHEKG